MVCIKPCNDLSLQCIRKCVLRTPYGREERILLSDWVSGSVSREVKILGLLKYRILHISIPTYYCDVETALDSDFVGLLKQKGSIIFTEIGI